MRGGTVTLYNAPNSPDVEMVRYTAGDVQRATDSLLNYVYRCVAGGVLDELCDRLEKARSEGKPLRYALSMLAEQANKKLHVCVSCGKEKYYEKLDVYGMCFDCRAEAECLLEKFAEASPSIQDYVLKKVAK